MEKRFLSLFCTGFVLSDVIRGFPIEYSSVSTEGSSSIWLTSYFITVFGFLLTIVTIIYGCICCRTGKGFKEFSNSSGSLANSRAEGFVNPTANAELTIFPPAGATAGEICRFEPLPDFKPQTPNLRPAAFSYKEREISSQDWFSEPFYNFPRNQLRYVEEYGRGWFGRVVEGEAQNIIPKEKLTKVMVKILHEDATPTDQMYFLHEVKFYKDLKHPNILRLLGRCLETEPFLIILECYPNGDLKTFLSQNMASARALVEQGATLQMCCNITAGLDYMHKNRFIHTDLAARNCLVRPDLTVKIGDYGNSIENFKSDYYCAGSVALPIRWCAPETLKCTDMTIETREVTPPANMWSLAIVFWEICEFCKLPYSELNDDEVIVRVLGDKNYFLEKPVMFCLHKNEMYNLMKLCWNPPLQRPTAAQVQTILENLISSEKQGPKSLLVDSTRHSQDFEQRWQNFKPNYIPKKVNADGDGDQNPSCLGISSILKNAKVMDSSFIESPLGVFVMSDRVPGQESPRFCLKSEKDKILSSEENKEVNQARVSDNGSNYNENDLIKSQNSEKRETKAKFQLNSEMRSPEAPNSKEKFKSIEADVDSWLKGVEINNEEDESFVRKISEAIRDLDAALALEKTSSSEEESGKSSHQNSPGKNWTQENNKVVVDFKLGSDVPSFLNYTQKSFELSSLQNSKQPQSLNFKDPYLMEEKNELVASSEKSGYFTGNNFDIKNYGFYESFKESDSLVGNQSRHSSDTDDEVWRKRIEKGEISEKVKEKSKSIANLMILTHIDASDDSDNDYDSRVFDKNSNRSSFSRRSGAFAKAFASSNVFGSENDLSNAVLKDDFKNSLKKLSNDHKEYGRFDSLGMILPTFAGRENVWENLLKNSSATENESVGNSEFQIKEKNSENERTKSEIQPEGEEDSSGVELSDRTDLDNLKNNDNFLGDIASEKLINKNESISAYDISIEQEKDENNDGSIDMEKSATSDYFSEKEDNLLQLKCDNNTFSTESSNSSKRNSSQLNEDVFEESTNGKEYEARSLFAPDESQKSKVTEKLPSGLNEKTPFSSKDENFLNLKFKIEEKNSNNSCDDVISCDCSAETCNTSLKIPQIKISEAKDHIKKNFEFSNFSDSDEPKVEEIFKTASGSEFEMLKSGCEKASQEEVDKPFQINLPKKNFKFVFNDDSIQQLKEEEKLDLELDSLGSLRSENAPNTDRDKSLNDNAQCDIRTVIVGPSEEFTLDFFKGLKTTSGELISHFGIDEKADWHEHIEEGLIEQRDKKDVEDCIENPFSSSLSTQKSAEILTLEDSVKKNFLSTDIITDFLKYEKMHTEKMAGNFYDLNRLPENEEDYDNFKFRTPDDERSSDSGFRDKGSLSESVEDACEGKYNLEDIEAELEEAYVKGAFGNCDTDKEPEREQEPYFKELNDSKNSNHFEFEEVKFYEEENKNEDDLSDMDGEIEFWHNEDESDYYPEISEFNPTCSQGWYLHPPEEQSAICSRNMSEDLVNALKNELRENLPIQTRSFKEFSHDDNDDDDFFKSPFDDLKKELNFHYATDVSMPLSPIVEEYDPTVDETVKKSEKSLFSAGNGCNRIIKKGTVNLMETVKAIDTNTFMQYLDYMVENEGGDFDDLDDMDIKKETIQSQEANNDENTINCGQQIIGKVTSENMIALEDIDKSNASEELFLEVQRLKDNVLEVDAKEDNLVGDDSLFFPEPFSPDRERSLSDISRSSNETQTGDALSEITLSSPDLVPDCFLITGQNNEGNEADKKMAEIVEADAISFPVDPKTVSKIFLLNERNYLTDLSDEEDPEFTNVSESESKFSNCVADVENNSYEMSTSFMGIADAEVVSGEESDENNGVGPNAVEEKLFEKQVEDLAVHWDSDSSATEEISSSSGEFIWKDGDKVSKLKVINDCDFEDTVFMGPDIDKVAVKDACAIQEEKIENNNKLGLKEKESEDNNDEDDEDGESSTGSSASITDFVPSAWNSQAIPGRSSLRVQNQDLHSAQKKKSVWFKKQKYHCVYEYPREQSDNEDTDNFNQFASLDNQGIKHFSFEVNPVELPNKHFPYGISNVFDYATCTDWNGLEGPNKDIGLIDSDSNLRPAKSNATKESNFNFYNLSPFDYDINSTGNMNNDNEFYVSSSSRPFQMSSAFSVFSEANQTNLEKFRQFEKIDAGESDEASDSRDFSTPDSGLEDSANASPLEKKVEKNDLKNSILLQMDSFDTLHNSKLISSSETVEEEGEEETEKLTIGNKAVITGNENLLDTMPPTNLMLPVRLGELRHARNRLKLDLPFNHNAELGAIGSKKVNRIH